MTTMRRACVGYDDNLCAWPQEQAAPRVSETDLVAAAFPSACPYPPDEVVDEDHLSIAGL